ncbi:hypothetical protein ACRC6Q_07865 [Planococcus sp. SE5232]
MRGLSQMDKINKVWNGAAEISTMQHDYPEDLELLPSFFDKDFLDIEL